MRNIVRKLRHYHSVLGFRGVAAFLGAKVSGTHPLFETAIAGIKHPVFVRIATTDVSVLAQVLVELQYDVPLPGAPKFIIDAGANIGLSAVFFANKFPAARIIALEPEDSNFELLKKNTSGYPQVTPLKGALWNEHKQICLVDPGDGNHGFQTSDGLHPDGRQRGLVQALSINSLMEKMGVNHVDLLKIDIEGSEKEVFETSATWIGKVDVIMAELHDHLKPGCTDAFRGATNSFRGQMSKGETVIRLREPSTT